MKSIYTRSAVVLLAVLAFTCGSCAADDVGGCTGCHPEIVEKFETSLHHTGAGMFDEYAIGAAGHFDIDMDEYYSKFKCGKCHASTCTQCHVDYAAASQWGHTAEANITIDTCALCHAKKQTSTYVGDMPMHKSQGGPADIHYTAGLICTDCHTSDDLHGTGVVYSTQLEAVSVQCVDCHSNPEKVFNETYVTQYSSETYSHSLHGDKLSCISCHSSWILSCKNCHLEDRKGMTVTADEFYLGKDKDGQITTFLKMDAEYRNVTHTGFGEWYGHTATDEPKDCDFCHENAEVLLAGYTIGNGSQIIGEGGSLIDEKTIDRVLKIGMSEEYKESTPTPETKKSFWDDPFDWLATLWE